MDVPFQSLSVTQTFLCVFRYRSPVGLPLIHFSFLSPPAHPPGAQKRPRALKLNIPPVMLDCSVEVSDRISPLSCQDLPQRTCKTMQLGEEWRQNDPCTQNVLQLSWHLVALRCFKEIELCRWRVFESIISICMCLLEIIAQFSPCLWVSFVLLGVCSSKDTICIERVTQRENCWHPICLIENMHAGLYSQPFLEIATIIKLVGEMDIVPSLGGVEASLSDAARQAPPSEFNTSVSPPWVTLVEAGESPKLLGTLQDRLVNAEAQNPLIREQIPEHAPLINKNLKSS